MIAIKNMEFSEPYYEFDVRVDRKTIFGNPFRIDDESLRDCALDKYQSYFHERIKKDVEFRNEVEKLLYIYEKHGRINLSTNAVTPPRTLGRGYKARKDLIRRRLIFDILTKNGDRSTAATASEIAWRPERTAP